MKALVIYDSVFGNTEQIAVAIGAALGSRPEVEVVRISEAKLAALAGLDLLVIGFPTRGFRPTPPIAEFLSSLPAGSLKGIKVAAFDTRVDTKEIKGSLWRFIVRKGGFAAKPIADVLQKRGGELALSPEGFIVKDRQGPLREGELERAADWARRSTG